MPIHQNLNIPKGNALDQPIGRVVPAPENTLSADGLETARKARRSFMGKALAMGAGVAAASKAAFAAPAGEDAILKLPAHTTGLGQGVATDGYGKPSKWESNLTRRESPGLTRVTQASVSFCPLQGLFGIITPSGLHFERHHQGWWDIDPSKHRFMVNGLVSRPRVFTMDDLMRLPSVSRIHFIECGANTGPEWGNVALPSVQYTHGMISCAEFTGVLLSTVLEMCGIDKKRARYVLAEGADGSSMTRTISMETAMDDVIVAWGMNGEMLRPENGYPLRLVVPGVQGVSWVKYLRRIEVGDKPYATKDEAVHYIDLQPDGQHRQYTSIQECKSVITTPSGGQTLLDQGYYNISGLAWSGRGSVKRVDVSVDGGRNWRTARMEGPVLSKALTRFNIDWVWDGKPAIIQSRAIDSTGYVQPKINQLRAVRGTRSVYHNNAIQSWKITENGEVSNVQVY
ncbi:MAG: sulfite dehydrogenase [Burkholderiaceae bacterium]|jgi:sulfane dehydrogenase subunit SoxC|nr:sulfite dehydrogenase [Burkholderiaceae bacterium]MDO7718031.1 sulfite dehydrogenase [Burkholderiaceae bacterium]MDP4697961.1 sulfite dehydrogenase [Burkholderiaceae bacterium]MDP4842403.1 sulfite dehydrogenase [Burkholderiaceae bacterium]|tara:strand:+ start:1231 stop:2598 length:1368 start_codon:yes stop_codon:yes gene_type:complete